MDFRPYADATNPAVDRFRDLINAQAAIANVPACALAATVEIESGGHNVLQYDMPAADGCGVGLCQITFGVDWSNPQAPTYKGADLLTPGANLNVAARYFLRPAIDAAIALRAEHGAWMTTVNPQLLFFAFAGYNGGTTFLEAAVTRHNDPDEWTTDRYASRALAIYTRNLERSAAPAKAAAR